MQLAILIILWLVYLAFGWPSRVANAAQKGSHVEKQSYYFLIVVLCVFASIYVTLVFLGDSNSHPWQQTQPVINAVIITFGIVFTAIRLFPANIHPFFAPVVDLTNGKHANERCYELPIPKGKWYPVYLAIINTSTFTWDNFRLTISLVPEDIEIRDSCPEEFPSCATWDYAPQAGSFSIGHGYIQKRSTSVLTIGETLANRFFVRANNAGVVNVTIMMTSVGRIGEQRKHLKLKVVDDEEKGE